MCSLYAICSTIYIPLSVFYQLLSSIYALRSTIYRLLSKPIYVLLSMFYQLLEFAGFKKMPSNSKKKKLCDWVKGTDDDEDTRDEIADKIEEQKIKKAKSK